MDIEHPDLSGRTSPAFIAGLTLVALLLIGGVCKADDPPANAALGDPPLVNHTAAKPAVTQLLTDDSLRSGEWMFVAKQKDAPLTATWRVTPGQEPVLVCTGEPYGYLRTKMEYADFQLDLEWMFPTDENGNSGILLYTSKEEKVWPPAIQIQLHQPVAGSIFPSGNSKSANELRNVRDVAKPAGQWNTCQISSVGGTISVQMNGKQVGEVTGCQPNTGWIALQSEGSEVHFRRMTLRPLAPQPATRPAVAPPVVPPIGKKTGAFNWQSPFNRQLQWPVTGGAAANNRPHCVCLPQARTVTHVVYRHSLAADAAVCRRCDWVRLDVEQQADVGVGDRRVRMSRRDCRHLRR